MCEKLAGTFFPETVIQCNKLTRQICLAESIDTFKAQVTKIVPSRLSQLLIISFFFLSFFFSSFNLSLSLLFFTSRTPLVIILTTEGLLVYRKKRKAHFPYLLTFRIYCLSATYVWSNKRGMYVSLLRQICNVLGVL